MAIIKDTRDRYDNIAKLGIHGESLGAADNFILPKNSEQMASASKGYTELHLIDGAAHAYSIFTDPTKYREYVEGFLSKIK